VFCAEPNAVGENQIRGEVTRQTANKAFRPALRMTFEFNFGPFQIKPSLFDFDGLG
jgi:hypothetical protein